MLNEYKITNSELCPQDGASKGTYQNADNEAGKRHVQHPVDNDVM